MKTYEGHEYQGKTPNFHPNSYLAEGAVVKGDVTVKEFAGIWHNVTARGDMNRIEVGRYTNIQDNVVLHVSDQCPCIIGDYVTVGHGAIVHGAVVEDNCLIGMGSIILDGAKIGEGSIIAAGALVPPGKEIPPYSLVMGSPGKVVGSTEDRKDGIKAQALKYKSLWTEGYRILPDAGGERYEGQPIVQSKQGKRE